MKILFAVVGDYPMLFFILVKQSIVVLERMFLGELDCSPFLIMEVVAIGGCDLVYANLWVCRTGFRCLRVVTGVWLKVKLQILEAALILWEAVSGSVSLSSCTHG
jgi:hypothetical protein